MKISLSVALLAILIIAANASEQQCESQYGPAPVYTPPAPVYTPPAPVYTPPAPVYTPPAPVYTPPAPVYSPPAYGPHSRGLTFDPRCAKYGYKNRDLKQRDLKVVTTEDLVSAHGDVCSDATYDIYLVVQGAHFAGLGVPVGKEYEACPNIVMHSKSNKDSPMEKVAMVAGADEVAQVSAEEKLHLGSRTFSSIVAAFDSVEPGKSGQKFYDAITNNCVALLRNMADPLDISIDDRMISFVSKRMLQSTADHMFATIRESPALNTLFEGGQRFLKGVSKEDMLAKLIKLYV